MNEEHILERKINKINWNNDSSIIKFINNTETDLVVGENIDGEYTVIQISNGKSMKVYTHKPNGYIKINRYIIDNENLIREETFKIF